VYTNNLALKVITLGRFYTTVIKLYAIRSELSDDYLDYFYNTVQYWEWVRGEARRDDVRGDAGIVEADTSEIG